MIVTVGLGISDLLLLQSLAIRGLTLVGVLVAVVILVVITLGATGFSDKILRASLAEEMRGIREVLAQQIRNPEDLEKALGDRRQELEAHYGLNRPWYTRLPSTVLQILKFDLGEARTLRSFSGSSKVSTLVLERLPFTLLLVTTASVGSSILGLIIGVKAATGVGGRMDRTISYIAAISYALPAWWTGLIFILVFSWKFGLFPSGGLYSIPPPDTQFARFLDVLWHAVLPVSTLILVSLGAWTYSVRTMVLNTAQEFFVTVARAKGLSERRVMNRYILRVAAAPIITSLVLGLSGSLGGAILTETVFNWPGMGRLYYDAITAADESVIIALTFLFTLLYVVSRFALEILYVILDPRVRYNQ